jgi:hypothetical protein
VGPLVFSGAACCIRFVTLAILLTRRPPLDNRQPENLLVLVSRTADDGVLGFRSLGLRALVASAMPAAATAASMAAAAQHQNHGYAEHQPQPILR